MAAKNIKGITVEIGGDVQPLSQALKDVNQKTKDLASELRIVDKLLKLDPSNTTLLAQKQTLLNKEIGQTEEKLGILKKAYDNTTPEEVGEEAFRELERQIIASEQKLGGLKSELDSVSQGAEETGEAAQKIGEGAEKSSEGVKKLSAGAVAAFAAIGAAIVATVKKLGSFMTDSVEASRELRMDLSKLEQNAIQAGLGMDDINGYLDEFVGLTNETDSSVEALSNLLATGFKGEGLSEAVEAISGAVIRFPDTLKIESLADSLQETIATGKATGQFAELLDRVGVSADAFSEELSKCSTQAQRQERVLQTLAKTGLANVSKQYKAANGEMMAYSTAQLKYERAVASLGKAMQPVMAKWKDALAGIAEQMAKLASSTKFQSMANKLAETLSNLIENVAPKIVDVINFVIDNSDIILSFIAAITAGLAAKKITETITGVVAGVKALIPALTGATAAQNGLNAAMSANVIAAVVAGITALIGVVKHFINTASIMSDEAKAMQEDTEALIDSTKESADAYKSATGEIEAQASVARDLVGEMERVKNSSLSAAAKEKELAAISGQLKGIYPELTDEIDAYASGVEQGADNILKYIDAIEAQLKAERKMERIRKLKEEEIDLEIQRAEVLDSLSKKTKNFTQDQIDFMAGASNIPGVMNTLSEEQRKLINDMVAAQEQLGNLDEALDANAESLASYAKEEIAAAMGANTLTEAEAQRLISLQENGAKLSEEQQLQLENWRAHHEEEYSEIVEANEEQRQLLEERVSLVTNAFERIDQGTAVSVENMIKNLNYNATAAEKWTENMAILAGSGLDKGFLQELRKKGPEAGAQVQKMVDYMTKTGDREFTEFNAALERAAATGVDSMNAEFASGDTAGAAANMIDQAAYAVEGDTSLEDSARVVVRETATSTKDEINRAGFPSIGSSIAEKLARGLDMGKWKVYDIAQQIARKIKSYFTFSVTASSSGNTVRYRGAARGAIVSREQIMRVAENGPEVISPISKLRSIVQGAMQEAISRPNIDGYGAGGVSTGATVSINIGTFVNNSESDIDTLTDRLAGSLQDKIGRRKAAWGV